MDVAQLEERELAKFEVASSILVIHSANDANVCYTAGMKHLLKERKGKDVVAKCLAKPMIEETTAWWTDVTCEDCLVLMSPPRPTRRLVRKR